jgi:hypothetical protein
MRKTKSSGMSDKEIRDGLRDGFIRVQDGLISFHYDRHPGGFARVSLTQTNQSVSRRERRLILKYKRKE